VARGCTYLQGSRQVYGESQKAREVKVTRGQSTAAINGKLLRITGDLRQNDGLTPDLVLTEGGAVLHAGD
jgi:hypothetical protein